jgi:uncharacterized delta-60 repeat protein
MHAHPHPTTLRQLAIGVTAAAAFALAGGTTAAHAAPGALDSTFASGGVLLTQPGSVQVEGVAVQPDGKVVVLDAGNDPEKDPAAYQRVLRFLPDGTPDPSFGGGDGVAEPLASPEFWTRTLGLAPDGKILVAGYSADDFAVARLMPDGSLDPDFDGDTGTGDGIVHTALTPSWDDPHFVGIDSKGRIVVGGNGGGDIIIARYLPDGKLDKSFAGDGTFVDMTPATEHVAAMATLDDGLLVTGSVGSDSLVARYTEQGAADTSFGTLGRKVMDLGSGQNDWADSVAVQPDGRIVLGIDAYAEGTDRLIALTPGGDVDTGFANAGSAPVDFNVNAIARTADNQIVAAGWGILNDDDGMAVERFNADGTPDAAFGGGATVLTRPPGGPYCIADFVAVAPDGKPVLGGKAYDTDAPDRLMLTRYQAAPDAPANVDPAPGETTPAAGGTQQPDALVLSGLKLTRKTFAPGRTHKRGTAFVFNVNRAATVTIRVKRLRHKGKVVKLKRSSAAGANRVRFSGRVGHRMLRPGRYRATLKAVDAAGVASNARAAKFRVVRG